MNGAYKRYFRKNNKRIRKRGEKKMNVWLVIAIIVYFICKLLYNFINLVIIVSVFSKIKAKGQGLLQNFKENKKESEEK